MNIHTETSKKYRSTLRGHVATLLSKAKKRAKDEGIPYDLDLEYVMSIVTTHCPVFNTELSWQTKSGYRTDSAPSLDKIKPELGYVKGNVAWVSWRANRIKNNGSSEEHRRIADWIDSV
jgi:hypothetical protein